MKKNDKYSVTCIDDTNLGFGVAKVDNQVVFIPRAIRGESLEIQITKVNKKYAYGRIVEVVRASEDRVEPVCSYARTCGGCQLQHMGYEAQLDFKWRHLQSLFRDHSVNKVIGMENPLYYRNKAQFPVQVKGDCVHMGFYRTHSNDIVDCQLCMIQDATINDVYQFVKENLTPKLARGLRHVLIRHSQMDEVQIVLIGRVKQDWRRLVDVCTKRFSNITSIVFNENTRNDNVILGEDYEVLYGNDYILESCMGNRVQLHFKSFFQVNPVQMERLYRVAIEYGQLQKDMTVVEMYSGTGTIGMAVSKFVDRVIGVEIVQEAVDNAIENCRMNGIENCTYVCQDASVFAHEMAQASEHVDVVFVDPPRKGMTRQGIQDIVTLNPSRVVYISCNPQTLARDIQMYEELGYVCEQIQPVDMFGYSIHVETVCLLMNQNA